MNIRTKILSDLKSALVGVREWGELEIRKAPMHISYLPAAYIIAWDSVVKPLGRDQEYTQSFTITLRAKQDEFNPALNIKSSHMLVFDVIDSIYRYKALHKGIKVMQPRIFPIQYDEKRGYLQQTLNYVISYRIPRVYPGKLN